ncbi:MAG TPA: DUF4157 domain-containing protein [Chitinophagaceae bacterium]|nr:DUF4157 domain-containing protein [Chitinophagaceae bacterium]
MKETISIRENSWMAAIAAYKLGVSSVAFTLGKTIHLHNTSRSVFLADQRWVRHEMAHIEQFRRHGLLTFIFLYLFESVRNGYYMNKFEVEARESETRNLVGAGQ